MVNTQTFISLIVAMADDNVIGKNNEMPWYIPEDFKHFKALTIDKPCIMGRKTYESIIARNGKALPGRPNIIVSRSGYDHEGAHSSHPDIQSAIDAAQNLIASDTHLKSEIMVIGGAQIYELALPLAQRIHLTRVEQSVEGGDAFFPEIDSSVWSEKSRDNHAGYSFITLEKAA